MSVNKVPPGFRQKFGVLIRYPLGFQILKILMRIRYPLKKPARVARRENFGDFKGVFKANRGGYPLRKPSREARRDKIGIFE